MKTKSDIIFNIIKCLPFVAYGVAIVFNIINRHYNWAVMDACLVVVYTLVLSLISKLESAMELADVHKKAYERECKLSAKALSLRRDVLDEVVSNKRLAEDMLRIFSNVDTFIEPEPLYKGRIVGINVRMDDRDNIPTSEYLVNITYDFGGREHTVLTTASEEDLKMLSDDD